MRKFLEDLRQELKNKKVVDSIIDEIIVDHEEMIANAIEEGLAEEDIEKKFGDPLKLASQLAEDLENEKEEINEEGALKMTLWKEFALQSDTLDVETRFVNDDIEYTSADIETIQVFWTKCRRPEDYEAEYDGKTLRLTYKRKNMIFNFNTTRKGIKFRVLLPKSVIVANFKHVGTNSDVEYRNIKIGKLSINTTNGDFVIDNVEAGETEWHSVNGDFKVNNSRLSGLSATMVSGDIQIVDTNIENDMEIGTVSGDVSVKNTKVKELDYHTVSGDFDGKEFYPEKVTLRSVSGDINIHNSEYNKIEIVSKKTVSGDIYIR
ncbi:MAG TPA: DUF4097 family beta strand repeat-containing protein [Bacillota bacterium]|nr:DUF4097 family beta strand repeat-containing protein [Bacillota bacterium]HPF42618.1 DUF4097 family beta strand repeat-containing protein [Bacillota bacterium]HPJ86243.1 DUF4097 family beta strand repeat-containing protein [Bacillota bacterium]HPQ62340.1 DUF4097 family beta strand repeat-containing protein [Bacillota bacterium]HRX91950.1 DUF4097 family beta strand repeat-containing protein [Candidatus Izemoplasmatales bacterium]